MASRQLVAIGSLFLVIATSSAARAQFHPGQFTTWDQDAWGGAPSPGNAAQLLYDYFDPYYGGAVEVGVSGVTGHSMAFTSVQVILDYLPSNGLPAPLDKDLLDPTSSPSGAFGGFVLAFQFNVDFSDFGHLRSANISFGDLRLVNMAQASFGSHPRDYSEFDGLSVRAFLDVANSRLGGIDGPYTIDDVALLTTTLTKAFEVSIPSEFAQNHLRIAPPGDFDNDGDADGADFLKWQRARGSADPMVDANVDGIVDGLDLAIWASSFGAKASGMSTAVPEPAGWALALLGPLAMVLVRQRKLRGKRGRRRGQTTTARMTW